MSETKIAKLILEDKEYQLPIYKSTIGNDVIDVTKLLKDTNHFTFDPGFLSTASCESKITFIDGEQGILRHRGYDIDKLANNCNFLEVAYLLLNGELPNNSELSNFNEDIRKHSLVHEQLHFLYRGFKRSAHPMAILVGAVGSLSAFYHENLDINNPTDRDYAAARIIAKIPTLAAMAYKYSIGQPFIYPKDGLSFAENFLHMMFATPCSDYKISPIMAKAMDKILILHADHEQNASTSTVRLAGSSGANPFACIASGIASLWGPAHGGANEAVLNMLKAIGSKENIPEFIAKAKDKNDPFRLMGFGHRVYKNYDPRAQVLREICQEVLAELGQEKNPLLEIAVELEKIALEDEYFIERKLYPNVDFYSGIIYNAMKIPPQMYTVLFAVARTVGWISQWKEMFEDENHRISRPRQLYTGHAQRDFVNIKDR